MDGVSTLAIFFGGIGSMLGRKAMQPGSCLDRPGGVYRFDGFRLDRQSGHLIDSAGNSVELTEREAALLLIFLEAPGQRLTRKCLADGLRAHGTDDSSVELEILGLRRKLEIDPRFPEIILTERDADGIGYAFALDVEGP
jgi:DNA-binding response OmpR family regulator